MAVRTQITETATETDMDARKRNVRNQALHPLHTYVWFPALRYRSSVSVSVIGVRTAVP